MTRSPIHDVPAIKITALLRRPLIALCAAASLASCGGAWAQPAPVVQMPFPGGSGKQVFVHWNFQGLPDYEYDSPDPSSLRYYRELYPLFTQQYASGSGFTSGIQPGWKTISSEGFTGVEMLQYASEDGSGDLSLSMHDAEISGTGMLVALCIYADGGGIPAVVNLIRTYVRTAANHPSAAQIMTNGVQQYIIYTYSHGDLSPADWTAVRQQLATGAASHAPVSVYFIADVSADLSAVNTDYFADFEAAYKFNYETAAESDDYVNLANNYSKPWAGGLDGGYDRETVGGGYNNALATSKLRAAWERSLQSRLQWMTIDTWCDTVERTEFEPDSEWNTTRGDITRWYSTRLRETAPPLTVPKLYVTTPNHVHLNQGAPAEALILNWSSSPAVASLQLVDQAGSPVGAPVTTVVPANTQGDATIQVSFNQVPTGRFVRAVATMLDTNGTVLQSVTSAPILVYERFETPDLRVNYYSIPADHAMPKVGLQVTGNPVTGGPATARVTPPDGVSVRYAEVLQNTREVADQFLQLSATPYATPIPLTYASQPGYFSSPYAQYTSYKPEGFYVARVIDPDGRVGYSDPVWFGPAGWTGQYQLINKASGLVASVPTPSTDGTAVWQQGPTVATQQNWLVVSELTLGGDDGYYEIANAASSDIATGTGASVVEEPHVTGYWDRQWSVQYFDEWGYDGAWYNILNRNSGLALSTAPGAPSEAGPLAQEPVSTLWTYQADKWRFEPVLQAP